MSRMILKNRPRAEFEKYGYKTIHLFGKLYLIRKYSTAYKRWSIYQIAIILKDQEI